ncbi:sulfur oxidation protein SoxZ [Streptococcus sanguinis SK1056]|uniref:Sulfur oxidation protein SoxZ n=1 Tax=Streptococcus sanguinis SK1056 TaxID=888820 RepID=F3UAH7_STRSA|nr:sulfur oxidation protein SoxZ [Streptococcus sanguinis SK1056]
MITSLSTILKSTVIGMRESSIKEKAKSETPQIQKNYKSTKKL